MKLRKDRLGTGRRMQGRMRLRTAAFTWVCGALTTWIAASPCHAGSVRVWGEAVVVEATVRLADVAELQGFDPADSERLGGMVVADAPPPGGSRYVTLSALRKSLHESGVNPATWTLQGASRCAVSRPDTSAGAAASLESGAIQPSGPTPGELRMQGRPNAEPATTARRTLGDAVRAHLHGELARYGGEIDVVFDRASEQVLALTDPPFSFQVRRRGGSPLGLTPLDVDVISEARIVQTVSLVAQVSLRRSFVSAARAVNQGATVKSSDVTMSEVIVDRLEAPWIDEPAVVVGQRAKRFIPQGTLLMTDLFESVPLVRRGELVTLRCVAGGVSIVTSARAEADGLFGESIVVRAGDARRVQYDAVVVGPGQVQMGEPSAQVAAAIPPEGNGP